MLARLAAAGVLALGPAPSAAGPKDGTALSLKVVVHGLRSQRGHVRVALYRDAGTWTRPRQEVASCVAVIRGGGATCLVQAPRPGRYAFAFLHDEDDDGGMTYGAFGFPLEGYGFSNDARIGLLPGSFAAASFEVPGAAVREATVYYPL